MTKNKTEVLPTPKDLKSNGKTRVSSLDETSEYFKKRFKQFI